MKIKAFTLAEVLITLTIIGVIAALTIPNLMNKYDKHVHEVKIKKFFSEFSNNVTIALKENGCDNIGCLQTEKGIGTDAATTLSLFFKNLKWDGITTSRKCSYHGSDVYLINGKKPSNNCGWGGCMGYAGVCVDGNIGMIWTDESFRTLYGNNCNGTTTNCASIGIFIDGKNQKPIIGKNFFVIQLRADGVITPPTWKITKTQAQSNPTYALYYLRQNNWQMDYFD